MFKTHIYSVFLIVSGVMTSAFIHWDWESLLKFRSLKSSSGISFGESGYLKLVALNWKD